MAVEQTGAKLKKVFCLFFKKEALPCNSNNAYNPTMTNPPRRMSWTNAPIVFSAFLLLVGALLLYAQLILGWVTNGKQMKLCAGVYGLTYPPQPVFSVSNLLNGDYQRALGRTIGMKQPFFPLAVRVRNQVLYSVFGLSGTPTVVLGNGGQLVATFYLNAYCTINLPTYLQTEPAWVAKVRKMQDFFEGRGQTFLYVITPSKLAQYPSYLPPGMPCPSTLADRAGIVPVQITLMQNAGVHTVDTTQVLRANHKNYPFTLYPRGGAHWNDVGAAIGAQSIEAALNRTRGDDSFPPFTFSWVLGPKPDTWDTDLATITNLFVQLDHYQTPVVTIHEPAAPACKKLSVVIVAGSFMQQIGPILSRSPCVAQVVDYFYWSHRRDVWVNGADSFEVAYNPNIRTTDLLHADIVLYEENESFFGKSEHGADLYHWVAGQIAAH
jgi:alginate O-acetyltransferase complex protein AlgJ